MAVEYVVKVHSEFEQQEFTLLSNSIGTSNVVAEADVDSAVEAFASTLVSGSETSYPLTLDSIRKTTTTSSTVTL
jgi:hypothetical protein